MKIFHNIYLAFLVLIFSVVVFGYALFHYGLSSVNNDDSLKEVVIEPGSVASIAKTLKDENLIRNELVFKLYVKISGKSNLKAATYSFSQNMGVKKIVDILYEGSGSNTSELKITFQEGLNMRAIARVIVESTNHTEEELFYILEDIDYLNRLIEKYWFLDNIILNENIYYSLEGYLYPSTYYVASEDVSIETILEMMLDEMEKQLTKYQAQIQNSDMSVHEILTLASIVELEGVTLEDRKGIAGVFFNRLDDKMTLGSDVTTYYGAKVDMGQRDLYKSEVSECNDYNTRCATFKKLPVSPICNSGIESIEAVLEPVVSNYYYFVADKNRKVYFSKNITEHNNIITKLKKEGLWYTYD